jgi:hypothetical protein
VSLPSVARGTPFPKFVAFFRRHPVLFLLCLSPGIPEYLSGSSSFEGIVAYLPVFLLFLALNLGLYGPGVLLIREALVRWRKGWAAVLALGAGYGILEEGTGLTTLFNPKASVVGGLGSYGHYLGVNWVWVIGVLQIHVVLSIGLPILLLGLALPETRGKPLLTNRQMGVALAIFVADIAVLAAIEHYYPVGGLLEVLGVVVALGLAYLAYRLPANLLDPTSEGPRYGPPLCFLLGLVWYPIIVLVPGIGEHTPLGAPVVGALEIVIAGALFFAVRRGVGRSHNEAQLVMLALGALAPIFLFGLIAQILIPIVLIADVLFVMFFYSLWRRYGASRGDPTSSAPGSAG